MLRKHFYRIPLALISCLFLATLTQAEIPKTISYQGYLKNSDGTPVSSPTSIVFSLYSSNPARNNPVWKETRSVTPVNGVYSVTLGSTTPINGPFDAPYHLGIKVESDAEMPLQPLSSAPYALRAQSAESVISGGVGTAGIAEGAVTDAKISGTVSPAKGGTGINTSTTVANSLLTTTGTGVWGTVTPPASTGQVLSYNGTSLYWDSTVARMGTANSGNFTASGDIISGSDFVLPATNGVIYAGTTRLLHSSGTNNFFAGSGSGNLGTFGNSNTGIGSGALGVISSGYNNTATGSNALGANTTGVGNTANGYAVLSANTAGNYNTGSGHTALTANTTGIYNTAYGASTLASNTIGSYNTANGVNSLVFNTTGRNSTAVGYNSLRSQSFSNNNSVWDSNNTAVGYESLYANQPTTINEGVNNTAVGASSLRNNTTGVNNTASGNSSLVANTTGSWNTAVGASTLSANLTGNSNTAVGFAALDSTTSGSNTAVGSSALGATTTGAQNVAIGYSSGTSNTTGTGNTFVGAFANTNNTGFSNATAVGYNAVVNASNKVRVGNTAVTVIEGQVGWSFPSDSRMKRDVVDIAHGLDFIGKLRPVEYRLKEGNGRIDFGFIAQEIEGLMGTGYNVLGIGEDADRTLSLRYTDFIAPMVKAMQEQQTIIEGQKASIDQLKIELRELKKLITKQAINQ